MKKWSSWRYKLGAEKILNGHLIYSFWDKTVSEISTTLPVLLREYCENNFFSISSKNKMLVKRGLHVLESNCSKTKTTEYRILDRRDKVSHCADFPHYLRASDDVDRISDQSHSSGQNISIFVQGILPCIFFLP